MDRTVARKFNRGALQVCGGLDIKLTKTPLIYSVSRFNLGGLSPPKPPPVVMGLDMDHRFVRWFREKHLPVRKTLSKIHVFTTNKTVANCHVNFIKTGNDVTVNMLTSLGKPSSFSKDWEIPDSPTDERYVRTQDPHRSKLGRTD